MSGVSGRGADPSEEPPDENESRSVPLEPGATRPQHQPLRFPMPPNLTEGGRRAFTGEIIRYANQLGEELDRQAVESMAQGTTPEHTADAVRRAKEACDRRLQIEGIGREVDRANEERKADNSVIAAILLTIATVGVSIMANFLHSAWQGAVFLAFAGVGITGLILTWTSRRRPRRR